MNLKYHQSRNLGGDCRTKLEMKSKSFSSSSGGEMCADDISKADAFLLFFGWSAIIIYINVSLITQISLFRVGHIADRATAC